MSRRRKVKKTFVPSKSTQMRELLTRVPTEFICNIVPNYLISLRNYAVRINDDNDVSGDSEPEQVKVESDRTFANVYKRRRHDKSGCLLCSSRNTHGGSNIVRSRKTSTSSVHRTRTGKEQRISRIS